MLVSPGTFHAEIGPFGPRNDHYIRDGATFQLGLGILALLALRVRAWQAPVALALAIQFGLHAASHPLDIDEPQPSWLGPAEFAGLAIGAALALALFVVAWRSEGDRG